MVRCANASLPASSTTATVPSTLITTPTSKATHRSGTTPTPGVTPIAATLLIQAVQSHLHFSQIRSWQEMGMHSHAHPLFQLVYRVRSSVDVTTIFDDAACKSHAFPLTPLNGNQYLQVVVWSLPRLNSIPQQLHSQSTISSVPQQLHSQSKISYVPQQLHSQSKTSSVPQQLHSQSKISSVPQQPHSQSIISSVPQQLHSQSEISSIPLYTQQLRSHSTISSVPPQLQCRMSQMRSGLKPSNESMQETFPFSPPTPSPLSPKLLAGLTDKLHTNVSVTDVVSMPSATTSGIAACMDRACGDIKCGDAMLGNNRETLYQDMCTVTQPEKVATSLGSVSNITEGLSSLQLGREFNRSSEKTPFESAPRAPGSPAPFSTAYNGSKSEKRRSCALTCKVKV